MATRHNTCANPACGVDAAGWGGGSTPTRETVAGFGRSSGARYTTGTFTNTSRGAVTGGQDATVSMYVYLDTAAATVNGSSFIEWRDSGGNVITYHSGSYSAPGRAVSRVSITGTAPANAAFASMITEGFNFAGGNSDFSMVLVEVRGTLGDYFDGDSPNAAWDGTPGSSASTLEDAIVSGAFHAVLPPLTGSFAGEVTVEGVLFGVLPALTASFTGHSDAVDGVAQLAPTVAPVAGFAAGAAAVAAIRNT